MTADQYFAEFSEEIDAKLASINGPDRLSRLRSYYFTWRLPQHPTTDQLHELVCFIAEARSNIQPSSDLSPLDALFSMSVAADDSQILEHCRRHYVVLREIQRELATH